MGRVCLPCLQVPQAVCARLPRTRGAAADAAASGADWRLPLAVLSDAADTAGAPAPAAFRWVGAGARVAAWARGWHWHVALRNYEEPGGGWGDIAGVTLLQKKRTSMLISCLGSRAVLQGSFPTNLSLELVDNHEGCPTN